jgi:hypothetical protein
MNDSYELFVRDRLSDIVDRMKEISDNIEKRVDFLNSDVMTTRNDPEVRSLWSKLCLLHMKGIVICEDNLGKESGMCKSIHEPQACIQKLHLSEEETCCGRYFKGKTMPSKK